MAPNAAEITVAANGTIWAANITGTSVTYPTAATGTLSGALWKELGYATEDGVTFSASPTVEDINAWQSATPVRRLTTARELTVAASLLQWNQASFVSAFGGGSWSGGTRYDSPGDDEALNEFAVVIDAQDGAKQQRWVIERANVTEAVEVNLVRSGAALLPVTFNALTRSGQLRAWYFYTSPALA